MVTFFDENHARSVGLNPSYIKALFFVLLSASVVAEKKVNVIKVVRAITGLGLKDAKGMVDGAPSTIKEGASQEEADDVKAQLEEAGATVELK